MAVPSVPYHPTSKAKRPGAAQTPPLHGATRSLPLPGLLPLRLLATWPHHPCPLLFCLSVTLRVHSSCRDSPGEDRQDDPLVEEDVQKFPRCHVRYSEYTPCEDVQRSLRFDRNRLIYRDRHCLRKHELLKCRVPAPSGYKIPFRWPTSRDFVWYANVPHKHLTVEKAVRNWIHYQGDRFKFPGGGTMFPNGADSYIDDIWKLINLRDGSISTAIDTVCGARDSLICALF